MRRNIRVKELHTPCAGTRPGVADPQRSKAAFPPPRREKILNVNGLERENVEF